MIELLANPAWHQGGGGGWWFLFPIAWFLLIGTLGFFAIRRWKASGRGGGPRRSAAEEALAERFARGDLSEDEFRERLAVLKTAWE